jgi:hypothetical protein
MKDNHNLRYQVALERWLAIFLAYLNTSNIEMRQRVRSELEERTTDAEHALEFIKCDIAVFDGQTGFLHGLANIVPWLESRERAFPKKREILKMDTLGDSQISSFTDGVVATLDRAIAEIRRQCEGRPTPKDIR